MQLSTRRKGCNWCAASYHSIIS